jgi:hypothetical protein
MFLKDVDSASRFSYSKLMRKRCIKKKRVENSIGVTADCFGVKGENNNIDKERLLPETHMVGTVYKSHLELEIKPREDGIKKKGCLPGYKLKRSLQPVGSNVKKSKLLNKRTDDSLNLNKYDKKTLNSIKFKERAKVPLNTKEMSLLLTMKEDDEI